VCRRFFLATPGIQVSDDRAVCTVIGSIGYNSQLLQKDTRSMTPKKTIDRTQTVDHIKSFQSAASHYRREHAPKRRYLASDISVEKLYKDLVSPCSYE
jgi:hypothetical protein